MSVFRRGLFAGQVALVTGGATGIGRAITEELSSLGCRVVMASRNEQRLQDVAAELTARGHGVTARRCNIRHEDQVRSLIEWTLQTEGRLDCVVNNGGGQFPALAEDTSLKGWAAVLETNLTGTFLVSREAYTQHLHAHGGAVVNIIADMWRGFPMMAHTGAARAGVDNLTKTLAVEWAASGVRVNAVAPGPVASPTAEANYGDFDVFEQVRPEMPAQRVGTPREVSAAVAFLLSPGASFISGATLRVDAASSLYSRQLVRVPEHERWPPAPSGDLPPPGGREE